MNICTCCFHFRKFSVTLTEELLNGGDMLQLVAAILVSSTFGLLALSSDFHAATMLKKSFALPFQVIKNLSINIHSIFAAFYNMFSYNFDPYLLQLCKRSHTREDWSCAYLCINQVMLTYVMSTVDK